ncbi:MAG: ATP-binding protein [Chroococcales cyanobacterium]
MFETLQVWPNLTMKVRFPPYVGALVGIGVVLAGVWILDHLEQAQFQQQNRAKTLAQLSTIRARLEGELNARLFLTQGVVAYASNHPNVTPTEFENLARVMVGEQTGILNFYLAKNNVITHVFPYEPNQAALGVNLLAVPEQRLAVERMIEIQETVVAGPVNLIQGGLGFISRTPIWRSPPEAAEEAPQDPDSYWGLAGIVIDHDTLLQEAGLFDRTPGLRYVLRGKDGLGNQGEVFFGSADIFTQNPVLLTVSLPNGTWELAAIPIGGWPTQSRNKIWVRTGGIVLALLSGILGYKLLEDPVRLEKAVERATGALRANEAKYRDLVENAKSMIVRLDSEGKIIFFNEFAQSFLGYSSAEMLGKDATEFLFPEGDSSDGSLLTRMANALEFPEQSHFNEIETLRSNGERVWISWRNKLLRSPQGDVTGMLCLGTDITELKQAYQELQYRLEFENLIATLSTHFINLCPEEIDKGINEALGAVGRFSQVDRTYIFQFGPQDNLMHNTYEWCAEGIESYIDDLQNIPIDSLPWFNQVIQKPEVFYVPRVSDLDETVAIEKELFESEHIQSLICVPMVSGGVLLGFVGFDAVKTEKTWSADSITLLKTIGSIFVNALERQQAELALQSAHAELEQRVEQRTAQLQETLEQLQSEMRDRLRAETQLQERVHFENLVSNLSSQFINIPASELDDAIHQALANIGEFARVDRSYIFQVAEDGTVMSNTHEWCAVGIQPEIHNLQNIPVNELPWLWEMLHNLEVVYIPQIDDLPPAAQVEYKHFQAQGIHSLICVPMVLGGSLLGFMGFDSVRTEKVWSEDSIKLLKLVGEIIVNARDRQQREQAIRESEAREREKAIQLQQTLEQLQYTQAQLVQSEKMSSLGQMVAGIAHEINNPITFISGNITPLQEYIEDCLALIELYQQESPQTPGLIAEKIEAMDLEFIQEDSWKILESMKTGSERIQKIVLSLRNFSRLDESEMKWVDLHEGLESTLAILRNRLTGEGKRPPIQVVQTWGELPLVECYPGQLNQVFLSLLSNAIDAVESSEPVTKTIRISTEVLESNRVGIEISDNGIGINPEIKDRIFDPFFTTKAVGSGTGLGLSIAYQIIVERHQGAIACHSQPGEGTTFAIAIPLKQNPAGTSTPVPSPGQGPS